MVNLQIIPTISANFIRKNKIIIFVLNQIIVRTVPTTHLNMTENSIKSVQDLEANSEESTKLKEAEAVSKK